MSKRAEGGLIRRLRGVGGGAGRCDVECGESFVCPRLEFGGGLDDCEDRLRLWALAISEGGSWGWG